MSIKEYQYDEVRKRIKHACECFPDKFTKKRKQLLYDKADNVAYCPVPKAASTTWTSYFLQLGQYKLYVKYVVQK